MPKKIGIEPTGSCFLWTSPLIGLFQLAISWRGPSFQRIFATCMALASYVWLIPGERGRRQRLGKVTKQGSPLLRFLWGEAGTHAVRCDPELKRGCQPPLLSSWPLVAPRQVLVTPRQVIPASAAYSYPRNVISLTASSPAHPGSLHNLFPIGRLKRVSGVHGLRSVGSFFGGRKW